MIHPSYTLRLLTIRMLLSLIGMMNAQIASASYTSIEALETRISEVESELSQLAESTVRGGVGAVGYRSRTPGDAVNPKEWVQVTLPLHPWSIASS